MASTRLVITSQLLPHFEGHTIAQVELPSSSMPVRSGPEPKAR